MVRTKLTLLAKDEGLRVIDLASGEMSKEVSNEDMTKIFETTSWEAGSVTSPKIVWWLFSCGVGATVMKNWDPLVPGPALAMASRNGRFPVLHHGGSDSAPEQPPHHLR